MGNSGSAPTKVLAVPQEFDDQLNAIDALGKLVEELDIRLNPVLRADTPEQSKDARTPAIVTLAEDVALRTSRIRGIAHRISSIISRLEL